MKPVLKLKNIVSLIVLTLISTASTFAQNAVDSDLSNTAGSNYGKNHTGMYIFIVSFLFLAIAVAVFESRKKAAK